MQKAIAKSVLKNFKNSLSEQGDSRIMSKGFMGNINQTKNKGNQPIDKVIEAVNNLKEMRNANN